MSVKGRAHQTPFPSQEKTEGCAFPLQPSGNDNHHFFVKTPTSSRTRGEYLVLYALLDARVVPSQL